jgi:glycosyltransferase involved in cell wall biosynthesis
MKRLDVRLIGPVTDISENSSNLREFALALSETGIVVSLANVNNVSPFKVSIDSVTAKKLEVMSQTPVSSNYVAIYMLPPELMRFSDGAAKANICWTSCGTDKIPYLATLLLNYQNINEVWVPTKTNLDTFVGCGINPAKIKTVPWGVDSSNYQQGNSPMGSLKEDGNFYFSYIGSLKMSSGFDAVLKAFYSEFKNEENVKLIFKAFIGNVEAAKEKEIVTNLLNKFKGDSKAEVVYIPGNINNDHMKALYHTGDCFVNVPRAKAWGNGIIKSMAAGVPVITNVNTGNRAYTNHQNSILIGSSFSKINDIEWLINNPMQQEHSWWEPNVEELKVAMRKVYSKEIDVEPLKTAARKDALKNDWKRVAMEVIKNIKKYSEA